MERCVQRASSTQEISNILARFFRIDTEKNNNNQNPLIYEKNTDYAHFVHRCPTNDGL